MCLMLIYRLKRSRPRWWSFIKPLSSRARPLRGSIGVSMALWTQSRFISSLVFKCMSMTSSQTACSASVHVLSSRLMFPTSPLTTGRTSRSLIKWSVKDSPQEVPLFQLGVMHFVLTSSQLPLCSFVLLLWLEYWKLHSSSQMLHWFMLNLSCTCSPFSGFNFVFLFFNDSFAYEIWWK